MKIGIFDSGLGGLVITKALINNLPEYDYLYYGDTQHLPYGEKTSGQILAYTLEAMKFLINENCRLIIIACNTATSIALRYIQQRFLPEYAPEVKVLGVVIPTVEVAAAGEAKRIGVVATSATVRSHIYQTELLKINPLLQVEEIAAPELVPAIEGNDFTSAEKLVAYYVARFNMPDNVILGCTHYPLLKEYFHRFLGSRVHVVSQDELMASKLRWYLNKHLEIESCLGKNGIRRFVVSRLNAHYNEVAGRLFPDICIEKK